MHVRFHASLRPLGVALLLAGCSGGKSATLPITQSREIDADASRDQLGATSVDRFGSPMGAPMSAPTNASPTAPGERPELVWDNPTGWIELPPRQYREANLQPAGNPDAECYLSVLPGSAGGLVDNVNRWRHQMGAEPIDATAIAALPRQKLLELDAVRLDLKGDFTTMDGAVKPGFALCGLIAEFGDQTLFLKMTGPADLVATEAANFNTFAASLKLVPRGSKGAAPTEAPTEAPTAATETDAAKPEAANPEAAAPKEDGGPIEGSSQGFHYRAPAGWTRGPEKKTRIVTLVPPGAKQTECAISVLGGNAGGVAANVDRWRGQLGLGPLTAAEFAKLPRVKLAGADGVELDLLGSFEDSINSRSIPQARMLGALALLSNRALFVKLTGPETEIDESVRAAFRDICASLAE